MWKREFIMDKARKQEKKIWLSVENKVRYV